MIEFDGNFDRVSPKINDNFPNIDYKKSCSLIAAWLGSFFFLRYKKKSLMWS